MIGTTHTRSDLLTLTIDPAVSVPKVAAANPALRATALPDELEEGLPPATYPPFTYADDV